MTVKVEVRCHHWLRLRWGQVHRGVDHSVYINDVYLRRFSTEGDMREGYWGRDAEYQARRYANKLARVFRTVVVWSHFGEPVERKNPCQAT